VAALRHVGTQIEAVNDRLVWIRRARQASAWVPGAGQTAQALGEAVTTALVLEQSVLQLRWAALHLPTPKLPRGASLTLSPTFWRRLPEADAWGPLPLQLHDPILGEEPQALTFDLHQGNRRAHATLMRERSPDSERSRWTAAWSTP
jgi:hypothetical protein